MKKLHSMVRTSVLFAVLCLSVFAAGLQQQPEANSGQAWDVFVNHYIESYFAANPAAAVDAGRHEFDGRLPDWSPSALRKEVAWLHEERNKAVSIDPAKLDDRRRFEREYLLAVITNELLWLEAAEEPFKNPTFYSGAVDPDVYISREYAPLDQRMKAYVSYAKAIPGSVQQIRANLRTPLPRTYAEFGKNTFGGLATYYANDVPKVFSSVNDPQLQAEFRAANETAIRAMKHLEAWFEAQRANATEEFALGPELFRRMLRETEGVDIPVDQLETIGRQDLDRNLAALREACGVYAPGKAIPECIAAAQKTKPQGSPVEGARRQLTDLKAFLLEKEIVSVPGTEEARVGEAPPYRRWNFAYIAIPGPYEKNLPSTYYIAPPDPSWSQAEREAYIPGEADLLFTSVHEVWPGHFLQFQHSNRAGSKFGQLFGSYAFWEGWAHYTEEMMWEAGLGNGDPEVRIGQLVNALMRNVRYLSAIGLHTNGMTVEQSERMFRDFAYQDPGNARQQAARGTFDPAYLNYTLGKLMIRKLREDWTATRGGRAAWQAFHDRFLSYGAPPIPLVRRAMLGPNAGPPL